MPERCGARFKKPVTEISDRAKRYRAHTPGCRPLGPKVCFKCGSRRNVVPDHIDGDESNGKRSNLRWACKRHNTILGKQMAKAGKGVRTRQYNPKRKRRNAGATNLAQYVQAAVDHTRKAHDAGGKVIHETPKARRREFAREIAWRKGYRSNPERPEAEKLSHAAVKFESPSRHPGQACESCIHFIAASPARCESVKPPIKKGDWCKRFAPKQSPADDLYRKFHGRGPDKITTMLVAGVDPYGGHPELTSLGPLIRLVVGEDVELSEDGEIVQAGWAREITFVPSMSRYRALTDRLDKTSATDVRQFKGWLKSVGAPDVAAVPNTRQLYFVGGNQNLDEQLVSLGADPEKDLSDLGFCYLIEYFAQKRFDHFEPITYYHAFGEVTGVQPRLIYRKPQKMLELVGGEYVVKAAGIDN